MQEILKVNNLNKSYGKRNVVNEMSFNVNEGEILCFLGPNGAGKSTTINMISGIVGYDEGEILYKNKNISNNSNFFKKELGVVPQDLAIYEDLSAENNVRFFTSLYGFKREELNEKVEKALRFVDLFDRKKEKISTFSGGMKRRLNIACAIAHEPNLLIMDEPTVGIDPQSRNYILDSIKRLRDDGMAIIYTTHYMEEVEEISDRILVIDNGNIVAEGTKEELKDEIIDDKQFIIEFTDNYSVDINKLYCIDGIKKVEDKDNKLIITSMKNIENLDKIISTIIAGNNKIQNCYCRASNLESVFLQLTGKSLRD